jgi:hypothetical protein
MKKSWDYFVVSIGEIRKLSHLYDEMQKVVLDKSELSDLLRIQLVNAVSAFDKFLHDLVRIGVVSQLKGSMDMEKKTLSTIHIDADTYIRLSKLSASAYDQLELHRLLENRVELVLKTMSFQRPEKIKDALSYIWSESNKWNKLATEMSLSENELRDSICLYVDRRNQIVHEGDFDPISTSRRPIEPKDVENCVALYYNLGKQVAILACGLSV